MEQKLQNQFPLTPAREKEIKETFIILSSKDDPTLLPSKNLKTAMMGLGLSPSNDEVERIINQLKQFKKYPKNKDLEYLNFKDFVEIIYYRIVNKSFISESQRAFKLLSKKKSEITKSDIEEVSLHFHEQLKPEEISKLISTADCNNDGKVTQSDFDELLKHTNFI